MRQTCLLLTFTVVSPALPGKTPLKKKIFAFMENQAGWHSNEKAWMVMGWSFSSFLLKDSLITKIL
jgi:hypothetical protein